MQTAYLPTFAQVAAVIQDAKDYWEAQDVELFLFGCTTDPLADADLFADEVSAVEWDADTRLAA